MTKTTKGQSNLGAMARRLKAELTGRDVGALSHTACMAVVAKIVGERNMMTALAKEPGPSAGGATTAIQDDARRTALEARTAMLQGLVDDALDLFRAQYEAEDDDAEINGGDMVEAFSIWREGATATLAKADPPSRVEAEASRPGIVANGRGTILLGRLTRAILRKDERETSENLAAATAFLTQAGLADAGAADTPPAWLQGRRVDASCRNPDRDDLTSDFDARWFLAQAEEHDLIDFLRRLGAGGPNREMAYSIATRSHAATVDGLRAAGLRGSEYDAALARMTAETTEACETFASSDQEDYDAVQTTVDAAGALGWLAEFRRTALLRAASRLAARGRPLPEAMASTGLTEAIQENLDAYPVVIGQAEWPDADGERPFWNSLQGWVSRDSAERFTTGDTTGIEVDLPVGGAWCNLDGTPFDRAEPNNGVRRKARR